MTQLHEQLWAQLENLGLEQQQQNFIITATETISVIM